MSATKNAGPAAAQLVPVHEDVVPFKYSTSFAALGGGGGGRPAVAASALPPPLLPGGEQQQQGAEPEAQRPPLDDVLEDFMSLDALPVEPAVPKDVQPAAAQGGVAAGGVAGALLDDYVSLGILEDPSAAATAKAAAAEKAVAAPRTITRPELLRSVPWGGSLKGIRSPLLRLHQEIVEFCRYLAPSPAEATARQGAIDSIEEVVKTIWPEARVEVFGSFATGLYLPTSDVDAVIMGSGCADVPQGLKALANALARRNMAKNMQVIAKAKVPIVKFEDAATGYSFDLSFDVANGPEAADNVRALMDSLPPMRPLVLVLKVFLQQRELNEVYSGGLGSYALLVMVAAFLQLHPSRQQPASAQRYGSSRGQAQAKAGQLESNLGVLLVDFLRLYGRALNNIEVGVSCRKGGSYFSKRMKGFFQPERPFLFAVEDPNDVDNDLGRNSYNISRVRMAFDWAYCQLTAPAESGTSLLQRIIRLDPVLFLRAPPPHSDADVSPSAHRESKRKRKKKKGEEKAKKADRRDRRQSAEEEEEEEEEEAEGRRGSKRQKRRHRERSLSDSEEGEQAGGSDGGRWQPAEADEEKEERRHAAAESGSPSSSSSSSEEEESGEERRGHRHKKHKHHHHHHHKKHSHKHQRHSGGGGRHQHSHGGSGRLEHKRRHGSGGGSGGSHIRFD